MSSRNHAIDALRALSVLYIVGYWHLFNYVQGFPGYANLGTEGLKDIILGTFTFTSGYLLAGKALQLQWAEVFTFYRRRLLRIYPLYAAALLLFLMAGLTEKTVAVKGLLLISMFAPPAPPTLWFITMIMIFYLVAPLMIHTAERPFSFLVLCGLMVAGLVVFHRLVNPLDLRILLYFPAFALGVAVARQPILRQGIQRGRWPLTLLALLSYLPFQVGSEGSLPGVGLLLPLTLIGTLVLFAQAEHYLGRRPNMLIFAISYASFCLYLFHRLVYKLLYTIYFPDAPLDQFIYLLGLGFSSALVLSYLIQKGYDQSLARRVPLITLK
jgi:peptidoglycan/LPS O-acetylase OafA/YrhL